MPPSEIRGTGELIRLAPIRAFAALSLAALAFARSAFAQPTDSALVAELKRYLRDGEAITAAPARSDSRDWAEAAAISGGLVLVGTRDDRLDAWVQSHRSRQTEDFARIVKPLGGWAAIGATIAALSGGLVTHNRRLLDTGRDAVEAEILAAGIATPVLKYAIGRARPSDGSDADEFRPFSGNASFPSGETTEAFAVASVLSARADGWVVPVVSYTLAACVGYARVHDRGHWASDAIAGGLVGTLIGRTIVRRHQREEEQPETPAPTHGLRIAPAISLRGVGFTARAFF